MRLRSGATDVLPDVILSNARVVLGDEVVGGTVVIRDGVIADISAGGTASASTDLNGDYLIPGLVELHTDHLETHYSPRPGVRWDSIAALQAHDAQIVSSGITTVFDCVRLGSDEDGGFERGEMRAIVHALVRAGIENRLRAEHFVHLRCEVSSHDVLEHFEDFETDGQVRLVSLMDHAPGQRQFQTLDQYELYYKTKRGLSDAAFRAFVEKRQAASAQYSDPHRRAIAEHCRERGITIASHDDATLAHVDEAKAFGVRLAEFPTSEAAAKASHESGISVLMGAPNVVRGKSHSGNVAARTLAEMGVLDVLSSDYVPFSLVHAPFVFADAGVMPLPEAICLVTSTPAKTVGFEDRGAIAPGRRADLVRVHHEEGVPVVRSVWREGQRVS
ncbi:alpha-D-ribose 1-methylphosphonate 5-triphosphate diphosphatase [Oricola cellulosilytica]|uniref:Alpha-D-ribose 1-methylphosphonate 5-triphosphate diphosphatase n=1 Tax=Oricola cellulosilytica TaxID=1429082 RepID=A0A4R0PAD9_9HYPH|nr:alpha-D-ribose 1-methylphosphonate 5-triphosphate diphosphatase [Oricola cellulosilytica]